MVLIISCMAANAQTDKPAGIYLGDTKLKTSRITGQRLGNLAGAYFTMGLSGAKRDLIIEGPSASTHIKDTKPEFKIVFSADSSALQYVFNDPAYVENILLVRLKKGKNRKMQNGSYGLTGVESNLSDKYIIPLDVEQISETEFTLTPREDLKKNEEYAFYFNIKEADEDSPEPKKTKPFSMVFDFAVDK